MSLCTLPLKLWPALKLQPGLDASSDLSLSEDCLMNNPQSRASLDYLIVNIKSLQI